TKRGASKTALAARQHLASRSLRKTGREARIFGRNQVAGNVPSTGDRVASAPDLYGTPRLQALATPTGRCRKRRRSEHAARQRKCHDPDLDAAAASHRPSSVSPAVQIITIRLRRSCLAGFAPTYPGSWWSLSNLCIPGWPNLREPRARCCTIAG